MSTFENREVLRELRRASKRSGHVWRPQQTTANNPWKPWPAALQDDLETVLDPKFNGESDAARAGKSSIKFSTRVYENGGKTKIPEPRVLG